MHRTLFDVGPFSIHLYGVMLAIAFWLGIELSSRLAKRRGIDPTNIIDLGIVVLISSVAGSRLLFVATHLADYSNDPLGVFRIWEGGLSFYGGLGAGVFFGIFYIRRKRLPLGETVDIITPQIALGISLARIGCFLNGCCFGKQCSLPWAVHFPPDSQAGWTMGQVGIHPTQLYAVGANFALFVFLRHLLRKNLPSGSVFYAFLILYGIWRFAVDFLRYYEPNMYVTALGGSITWTQLASLAIVVVGIVKLLKVGSKAA